MDYIFHGHIYPDHTYFQIGTPLQGKMQFEEQEISISLHIYSSNVTICCSCEKQVNDILTFRNYLLNFSDDLLNVICLLHGVMYRIELLSYTCPEHKTFVVFKHAYEIEEQKHFIEKYGNNFMDILFCMQTPVGFFVSDCLRNMKLSMTNPIDTGFFIYRCIENIRNSFMHELDIPEDKEKDGWKAVNDALGGKAEDIHWIRSNYSLPRRHGRGLYISGEERYRCITIGYKLVFAWIEYVIDKYKIDTQTTTPVTFL